MKPDRIRILLSDLDEYFAKDENAKYLRLQMQSVREMWEFLHTNNAHNSFTNYQAKQQQDIQLERQQAVKKQVSEAQAAAERRRQNEERTRQRKAAREAERLKRKKIEETRKRVNADAAKAVAERKAQEAQRIQAQKEAMLKAKEEARKAEIEQAINHMFTAFDEHKNLPPIYEKDKNGNDCFYLKINNKVMHIVMSETEPLCHFISKEPVRSRLLTPYDIQDIMTNIDTHLNADGKFDDILGNFGSLYNQCQQIIANREEKRNKKNKGKIIGQSKGGTVPHSDIEPLYKKVCRKLMSPTTFEVGTQNQRN
jgi:multidrug efflux pump subunit AcrA (membrane-fusion protein)